MATTTTTNTAILIRYGEIALKSPRVRARYERALIENIETAFIAQKLDCIVRKEWGRLFLYTNDLAKAVEILIKIFGIVSVSKVVVTDAELSKITQTVCNYADKLLAAKQTFAICTRRTGGVHKFTSQDVSRIVGNAVLTEFRNRNLAVNLTAPDVKIYIEIRGKRAYIFSEKHVGPGGFPLGTQGKAVALITDRKTVIASWLIMRRGCRVIPAYFEVDDRNVKSLINRLGVWDIRIKPYIIKSTEYQFDIEAYNKFGYSDEIYELASTIASRVRADVIISGETLDQLKNKVKAGYTCKYTGEYPIFYPLIGLDDDQMTIYAELIGV